MLGRWLACSGRPAGSYDGFTVVDVLERSSPAHAGVEDHLRDLVRDALVGLDFLVRAAARLGWQGVATLLEQVTPKYLPFRRGDFGEMIACGLLEQLYGYSFVTRKLRYKLIGDQTLPATDALALRTDGNGAIAEVAFIESKLSTAQQYSVAAEAYRQLEEGAMEDFGAIVMFAAKEMDRLRQPAFDAFLDYLRNDREHKELDSYRIMLTWEEATWSDRALNRLQEEGPQLRPLAVTATRISGLGDLVDRILSSLGFKVEEDG